MRRDVPLRDALLGHPWGERLLATFSFLYQAGARLRHWAYENSLFPSHRVPAVVISIGNIVAGGTGKTPLVHFLAEQLSKRYSLAILSRGYRSAAEKKKEPTRVDSHQTAAEVGDEPRWLANQLPHVPVWVCASRFRAAQRAIAHGAEVLLLDDGFQHRQLHRDFDVVIAPPLTGKLSRFLPWGELRDLPQRLRDATLRIAMKPAVEERRIDRLPDVVFETRTPLSLAQKRVALFCAIAHPERFIRQVIAAEARLERLWIKPDHEAFSLEELEQFYAQGSVDLLVCTEKDAVKLPPIPRSIPLQPVPLVLHLCEGHKKWEQFLQQIQSKVDHARRVSGHTS